MQLITFSSYDTNVLDRGWSAPWELPFTVTMCYPPIIALPVLEDKGHAICQVGTDSIARVTNVYLFRVHYLSLVAL